MHRLQMSKTRGTSQSFVRCRDHGQGSMASLFELSADAPFFDCLPLECDGMVTVASAVLERDGVPHRGHCGSMSVQGIGTIPLHCWISLPSGQILDLRARMWLGDDARVPHGVFYPANDTSYVPRRDFRARCSEVIFTVLAGQSLTFTPPLLVPQMPLRPQQLRSASA